MVKKRRPIIIPTDFATPGSFLGQMFTATVMQERIPIVMRHAWATRVRQLHQDDAEPVSLLCAYDNANDKEVLRQIPANDALVYLRLGQGLCRVVIAAECRADAKAVLGDLLTRYPVDDVRSGAVIPMVFWARTEHGANNWRRNFEVPRWADVADNYAATTRAPLQALMAWESPRHGGQLLLWHGPPGTGKTWAIRALASEWRDWCQFEYVTDPDDLFERASYLTSVMLLEEVGGDEGGDKEKPPRWRCFILEDTGEMLMADAKTRQGQAMSRLLNVVDGLMGQGLRILLLITTNEEVKELHPAITRPGRCLYNVHFDLFESWEAEAWLRQNNCQVQRGLGRVTLAQMFQHKLDFPLEVVSKVPVGFRG